MLYNHCFFIIRLAAKGHLKLQVIGFSLNGRTVMNQAEDAVRVLENIRKVNQFKL